MFTSDYTTKSKPHKKTDTIEWTVPNFLKLLGEKQSEFVIEKPKHLTEENLYSKFSIMMKFFGISNDIIEIYYSSSDSVFISSSLKINAQHSHRCLTKKEYQSVQCNKWYYLDKLIKSDITKNRFHFLLSDGGLNLIFDFKVLHIDKEDYFNVYKVQISNDFESLFNSNLFSDAIIKCAEGNEFNVHKVILASRSLVLKAHFQYNATESLTNIIESPFESKVLKEVLDFIYTDKAPRVNDMPEKLLAAADYYQLYRLKCLCEESLNKKLTIENAVKTLYLADLHSAETLKQCALEFIKAGQTELILKTEGWTNLKSVELVKEFCKYNNCK